jgi:hypothetical protein
LFPVRNEEFLLQSPVHKGPDLVHGTYLQKGILMKYYLGSQVSGYLAIGIVAVYEYPDLVTQAEAFRAVFIRKEYHFIGIIAKVKADAGLPENGKLIVFAYFYHCVVAFSGAR